MSDGEQMEMYRKAAELKHRLEGSSDMQRLLLGQYSTLCMMGAFTEAEKLRSQVHDYLDVFLDSCVENSRLCRKMQGLS
jgi:hypothetical protein